MRPNGPTLSSARAALAWLLVLLPMLAWLGWRLASGPVIDADLLSLLPETAHEPALAEAAARFREAFERRVLFVVAAPEAAAARAAAYHLGERLAASALFPEVRLRYGERDLAQIGALYFPHRFQLLADRAREQLEAGDWGGFEQDLLTRYFSPMPGLSSALVGRDPLLLLAAFVGERAAATRGRFDIEDGYLSARADGRALVLLSAELGGSPFSLAMQEQVAPLIASLRSELPERFPGSDLLIAGVLLHA